MSKEYIIVEEELRLLLEREAELLSLKYSGVDNWEWYEGSLNNAEEVPENLGELYEEVERCWEEMRVED